ncbi:hypothetical protein CFP56_040745 [Quercus suber]|uniref:Uncharacterized protein n=1 Tax=Quercus suber TaxID=58331 RepID=A0AAW0LN30_QUESU
MHSDQEKIDDVGAFRLVAFSLGYLPGGDKTIITKPETTLLALEAAKGILMPGGLISLVFSMNDLCFIWLTYHNLIDRSLQHANVVSQGQILKLMPKLSIKFKHEFQRNKFLALHLQPSKFQLSCLPFYLRSLRSAIFPSFSPPIRDFGAYELLRILMVESALIDIYWVLLSRAESETVHTFASKLPVNNWVCCKFQMLNQPWAPILVLLFKR